MVVAWVAPGVCGEDEEGGAAHQAAEGQSGGRQSAQKWTAAFKRGGEKIMSSKKGAGEKRDEKA